MNIIATGMLSKEDGALYVDLEFHPANEMEHEILAEFVSEQVRVSLTPTKLVFNPDTKLMVVTPVKELEGDLLHVRLCVGDGGAFDAAVHNLENKKRIADGRPTIEQEAAAAAQNEKQREQAEKDGVTVAQQIEAERLAARDRIEKLAATEIADRALAPHAVAPAAVSEGTKADKQLSEPQNSKEPKKLQ